MTETPQNTAPAQTVMTAPRPEVIASYGHAWKQLWKNFPMLLLVLVIYLAMTVPGYIPLLGVLYSFLVMLPLAYGLVFVNLKAARGEEIAVGDLFAGFKSYGSVLLAGLLTGLIVLGGFILLIVPGIIFACKLSFVPLLVIDQKKGAIEAIKQSWNMTSGYSLKIFLMLLLAIPIMIAGVICLCVGLIPASMWIGVAMAAIYYAVVNSGNKPSA